jgi:hypothetical protein
VRQRLSEQPARFQERALQEQQQGPEQEPEQEQAWGLLAGRKR